MRAQESQARGGPTIHEEMLREADALVVRALSETEARCAVLAQYISDCDRRGLRTAAWSGAVGELRALQDYRRGLLRRHSLIQQALEHPVGECPEKTPPPVPSPAAVRRTQQQVQIRAPRRS